MNKRTENLAVLSHTIREYFENRDNYIYNDKIMVSL